MYELTVNNLKFILFFMPSCREWIISLDPYANKTLFMRNGKKSYGTKCGFWTYWINNIFFIGVLIVMFFVLKEKMKYMSVTEVTNSDGQSLRANLTFNCQGNRCLGTMVGIGNVNLNQK